ncbi:MAG: ACT domain-containing protein [Spirochaetota bacterium]
MASHAHAVAKAREGGAEGRVVIAVIGEDRPGIMAGVTAVLADRKANILDVNQTIMSDLFTMVMLVDIKGITVPFPKLKTDLEEHERLAGLSIIVQHEEIFKAMHRV